MKAQNIIKMLFYELLP